jgi:colanic acid/amylovoran biosynthesis glycosyltransferase
VKKIAYIMSRFPHLPETFILREMIALEQLGFDIALFPLMVQKQSVIHAEAREWLQRARRIGWISVDILLANLRYLFKHPIRYVSLWFRVLTGNLPSPKFLARSLAILPKAVLMGEMMQAEKVEHIHAHYATHPAMAAWIIHQLTHIPYSITVHAHDIYVNQTMLEPKVRDAAFVVAISEYNRRFLGQHLGAWAEQKTRVVHCGIQPERYTPVSAEKPAETFQIVSIGSLQPYKGQRYLVEACEILRQMGVNFHCRIIGGGELKSELEELISAKKLGGMVDLTGPLPQDSVAKILREADCYVQPSIITPSKKMEGIPVAIMEAMSCALPVVATDISGIPELVRQAQTGQLVPEMDSKALAEAIAAIHADRKSALEVAQAGRKLVLEEFDLHDNVSRLAGLFQAV